MATFHGITRKHIGGRLGLHTESVELFKLDIEVELLVEEDEEVEEEGLVTVGWMEGRSREPFGPFDTDFLPLASHGWAASCSRLSLDRGSVSRQACIKSLSAGERAVVLDQSGRPCRICSSSSKGMSPTTRSCKRIPRLHTVRLLAEYRRVNSHSGGAYTRVPSKSL